MLQATGDPSTTLVSPNTSSQSSSGIPFTQSAERDIPILRLVDPAATSNYELAVTVIRRFIGAATASKAAIIDLRTNRVLTQDEIIQLEYELRSAAPRSG